MDYFNIKQFQELRELKTFNEVKEFFEKNGYTDIVITSNPKEIIDNLQTNHQSKQKKHFLFSLFLELILILRGCI